VKGWSGTFATLELRIGGAIDQDATDAGHLCQAGVFVWSKRTLTKLDSCGTDLQAKKLRLAPQMMQFMYVLMIGKGSIADGVRLTQYLGPLEAAWPYMF
jgi:hypothetical protein